MTSPKPSAHKVRKTPEHSGRTPEHGLDRAESHGGRLRRRVPRGRLEGPHLATDLPTFIPHFTAERQDIARDHAPRVHNHVAIDCDQVAPKRAVDIGVAINHQEMSVQLFR